MAAVPTSTSTARVTATTPAVTPPDSSAGAPSPAVAPPPGNPRFPLFDGMRALAVLAVLAFHAYELTGRVGLGIDGRAAEVLGNLGPILFFVISGFLLYRPYVAARAADRPGPRARRYARRRVLRIVPAYWVALTVLAIFPGIVGVLSHDWWRYYGFLQLYSARTEGRGIAVAWTLCVEVSFYIALPLWAVAIDRLRPLARDHSLLTVELAPIALVALAGALVQLLAARQHVPQLVGSSIAGQCTWLLLGMAFAVVSVMAPHHKRLALMTDRLAGYAGCCWIGAVCAFVGLMALVPSGGLFGLIEAVQSRQSIPATLAKIALTAAVCALLVAPVVFTGRRPGLPRRLLAMTPVAWLGLISYSFYLWHLTIAELIAWPKSPGDFSASGLNLLGHVHVARPAILFVVTFAVTAAIATVSYQLVELPFLRRKESR